MVTKILLMAIVLIGLVISGCTEDEMRPVNNSTDMHVNASNATANVSEDVGSTGVSVPLEKPPFI